MIRAMIVRLAPSQSSIVGAWRLTSYGAHANHSAQRKASMHPGSVERPSECNDLQLIMLQSLRAMQIVQLF
jgi:hypothetical protein